MKPARLKRCKACGAEFRPLNSMAKVCSVNCAISLVAKEKAQAERRQDKVRRESLKTRSDYIKEAQVAFNSYVRVRDCHRPCICCGSPLVSGGVGGGFDCGHYRSVGSAPHLRFDERNAHGQTKKCNRYGAGRAVDYRKGLIVRIGLEAVEALEASQGIAKWSIDELRAIRACYRAKRKALLAEQEQNMEAA